MKRAEKQAVFVRALTVAVGLLGGGLGAYGFWTYPCSGQPVALWEVGLQTLRLFTLNVDPDGLCSVPTQLASFLAPVFSASVLIIAFSRVLGPWWRARWLWLRPADDLFLGGGETAAAIARRRHGGHGRGAPRRRKTVGLDPHRDAPLALAMDDGFDGAAFTLEGDALVPRDLNRVNAGRAGNVWVHTGDDSRNLDVASRVLAARPRTTLASSPRNRLFVHIRDTHLIRARESLLGAAPRAHIEYFNLPRLAARALLRRWPPPYLTDAGRRRTGTEPLHLCVVGSGDLAAAILAYAAAHCVYDEPTAACVRITLVGRDAAAQYHSILRRHPAFDPQNAADPRFAGVLPIARVQHLDCDESELAPRVWEELQADGSFSIVYVAAGSDLLTRSAALRVTALRDACAANHAGRLRIIECMHDDAAAASTLRGRDRELFGIFRDSLDPDEAYPGAGIDDLAKAFNYFGYRLRNRRDLWPDPLGNADSLRTALRSEWPAAEDEWVNLAEEFRWSNRFAADHAAVKLTLLGFAPADFEPEELTLERIQRLTDAVQRETGFLERLEHRRYIAERLIDGWLPLAGSAPAARSPSGLDERAQKEILRLNRSLVPFPALLQADAEKDEAQVHALRVCLAVARENYQLRQPAA
jgi:hypothetical protein